jgi:hypothetical protein
VAVEDVSGLRFVEVHTDVVAAVGSDDAGFTSDNNATADAGWNAVVIPDVLAASGWIGHNLVFRYFKNPFRASRREGQRRGGALQSRIGI